MKKSDLLESIRLAFDGMEHPSAKIAPCECEECRGLQAYLSQLPREAITKTDMDQFFNTASMETDLISDEAKIYYLPVLMLSFLEEVNLDVLDNVLRILRLLRTHSEYSQTSYQREVIKQFLCFVLLNEAEYDPQGESIQGVNDVLQLLRSKESH
ncbi:MAG: hypothetical protein O7G85_15190 [Planctomycetota bacterium]|nr:hypothetical protein [Planctomycetota bacterium]